MKKKALALVLALSVILTCVLGVSAFEGIEDETIFMKSNPMVNLVRGGFSTKHEVKTLKAGYRTSPLAAKIDCDIIWERNIPITFRDGVTIYADVFRPVTDEEVPLVISWCPYGKEPMFFLYIAKAMFGVKASELSGLDRWEAIDPAYWVANGYAVCQPNPRGSANSEGNLYMFGKQEAEDIYDTVEYLAVQDWCNGKVGMAGNSWLSVCQWFAAAEQPPHLTAIAPWEGFSDMYRDVTYNGGIEDISFISMINKILIWGQNGVEDITANSDANPLYNDYWATKTVDYSKINIPVYCVASYSNTLHTNGTFRAFDSIASEQKWLRIHNEMEWPDLYNEESQKDLMKYYDYFLKGEDNGWDETPEVRYSLLDMRGNDETNIATTCWPPAEAKDTVYYLDNSNMSLTTSVPSTSTAAKYDSTDKKDFLSYDLTFDKDTALAGYPTLKLYVSAEQSNDIDLFVSLEKVGSDGKRLCDVTADNAFFMLKLVTQDTASPVSYVGSQGRLRVSLRNIDESKSIKYHPYFTYDQNEYLSEGEIVEVTIPLMPVGLKYEAGSTMRVTVSGQYLAGGNPMSGEPQINNSGNTVIHTGGQYQSQLTVQTIGN